MLPCMPKAITRDRLARQPHKKSSTALWLQIVRDVAAARALTAQQVLEALDVAPHGAERAQQLRLIDGQLYRDQALKLLERMSELKQRQHGQAMVATLVKATGSQAAGSLAAGAESSGPQPDAGNAATAAGLLEQPDAEAGVKLPRVQLQRYMHVLEVQEAKQHKEHVQSSLNKVGGGTLVDRPDCVWDAGWACFRPRVSFYLGLRGLWRVGSMQAGSAITMAACTQQKAFQAAQNSSAHLCSYSS